MNLETIKQEIRGFLLKAFRVDSIKDADNIFDTGIVHSLFFIQLLVSIEKKFKIELIEGEFDIDKLVSIDAIANLVYNKLASQAEV